LLAGSFVLDNIIILVACLWILSSVGHTVAGDVKITYRVSWTNRDMLSFTVRVITLPRCASVGALKTLEELLRKLPGMSTCEIEDPREVRRDPETGTRHGRCVARAGVVFLDVQYVVGWTDRETAAYSVRLVHVKPGFAPRPETKSCACGSMTGKG
jgi:hypothetical protein